MLTLVFDVVLVAITSLLIVTSIYKESEVDLSAFLAGFVCFTAQIIGAGLILGYLELLTSGNLRWLHVVTFLVTTSLLFRNEGQRSNCLLVARSSLAILRRTFVDNRWLAIPVIGFAGLLLITAAFAYPLNYDSQCYRLSRIGVWLQEHSIRHFETGDSRQNYHGINGDLLMLWGIAHFDHSYPLSNIWQAVSGIFLLLSTALLAKFFGVRGRLLWLSVVVILSMPVFVAQATTSQNDLIVAVFITAGLYFLLRSLRDKTLKMALLGWICVGLACGTKGTVFYWGPGLAIAFIGWLSLYGCSLGFALRSFAIGTCVILILGAPRYVENTLQWGNPFSSPDHYEMMHGSDSLAAGKTVLNAYSIAIQGLAPISNPFFLKEPLSGVSDWLIDHLPKEDGDYLINGNRERYLRGLLNIEGKASASDVGSLGLLFAAGLCLGLVECLRRRQSMTFNRKESAVYLLLLFSVAAYLLLFCSLFKYQPYTSRYLLMIAPVGAVGLVLFLQNRSMRIQNVSIVLVLAIGFTSSVETYLTGKNSGFENLFDSQNLRTRLAYEAQNKVLNDGTSTGGRLLYSFRDTMIHAGILRSSKYAEAKFISLEEVLESSNVGELLSRFEADALIIQNGHPFERGRTFARAYAYEGNAVSHYGFTFLSAQDGEAPVNAYIRGVKAVEDFQTGRLQYSWQIDSGDVASCQLTFQNSKSADRRVTLWVDGVKLLVEEAVSLGISRVFHIPIEDRSMITMIVSLPQESVNSNSYSSQMLWDFRVDFDGLEPLIDPSHE